MLETKGAVAAAPSSTRGHAVLNPTPSRWTPSIADIDLVDVAGVKYRVHEKGGGLVALTARVEPDVYVDKGAMVKDRAIVVGGVRLFDRAVIEGDGIVADSCTLRGGSSVGGEAIVRGNVTLAHSARIDGDARVTGGVQLQHFAHISRGTLSGGMTVN